MGNTCIHNENITGKNDLQNKEITIISKTKNDKVGNHVIIECSLGTFYLL